MWIREYKQLCTKIWEEIREAEAVVTGGIPVKSCPGKLYKIDTKTLVKLMTGCATLLKIGLHWSNF